ncbi:MAG: hypothetical protein LUE92_13910 [Clostridiales bacterium]|nr:hypothetical protein [Clostridiales bacterium]
MTKIEMAIQSINWKIEDEEKTIEEMRRNIKNSIDSECMARDAGFILQYAQNMANASQRLYDLGQQRRMLESIAADK